MQTVYAAYKHNSKYIKSLFDSVIKTILLRFIVYLRTYDFYFRLLSVHRLLFLTSKLLFFLRWYGSVILDNIIIYKVECYACHVLLFYLHTFECNYDNTKYQNLDNASVPYNNNIFCVKLFVCLLTFFFASSLHRLTLNSTSKV